MKIFGVTLRSVFFWIDSFSIPRILSEFRFVELPVYMATRSTLVKLLLSLYGPGTCGLVCLFNILSEKLQFREQTMKMFLIVTLYLLSIPI